MERRLPMTQWNRKWPRRPMLGFRGLSGQYAPTAARVLMQLYQSVYSVYGVCTEYALSMQDVRDMEGASRHRPDRLLNLFFKAIIPSFSCDAKLLPPCRRRSRAIPFLPLLPAISSAWACIGARR
jgi:hypothetical protein